MDLKLLFLYLKGLIDSKSGLVVILAFAIFLIVGSFHSPPVSISITLTIAKSGVSLS